VTALADARWRVVNSAPLTLLIQVARKYARERQSGLNQMTLAEAFRRLMWMR
jgi:hypothetical protein